VRVLWILTAAGLLACGEFYEVHPGEGSAIDAHVPADPDAPVDAVAPIGSDIILDFTMSSVGAGSDCVIDLSAGHHDGACDESPPSINPDGVVGSGFHFTSDPDATSHSEGFTLVPTGALTDLPQYTVSVWLRMQLPLISDYECPLNRVYDSSGGDTWQICLGPGPEGVAVFLAGTQSFAGDLGSAWTDGNYHHFALVYVAESHQLYLDGAMVGSAQGMETSSSADLISIGRDFDPNSDGSGGLMPRSGFQGDMDELRIYNRALSQDEITNLFLHPSGS
jgi:hypothetical protein